MKSAIIENGIVVNVILGALPESIPCEDGVGIGWSYDGASFIAPEPEPELPLTHEELQAMRQAAYTAEADPIAMQMLRDEATKEEWLAKINEIKARFPYPDEDQ